MTVVVAFLCTDGVVVAADSMLTPSMGNVQVGHHKGKKVNLLPDNQIFAFAGDHGQAMRFHHLASAHSGVAATNLPIGYALALAGGIHNDFKTTGITPERVNVNTILSFLSGGAHHCCVFEGTMQPRMLDSTHYYVALGIGKLSADPFLRFLVDTFCQGKQPRVKDAVFLAYWTVQHAIDTSSGGVDGPIRIAVGERNETGQLTTRELSSNDNQEHMLAMESAAEALRTWRDGQTAINALGKSAIERMPLPPVSAS